MPYSKEERRAYDNARYARRRAAILDILGGRCVICESTDALEAHHTDPAEKSFTVASNWTKPWKEILEELAKCELLCAPCHDKHHTVAVHGTRTMYNRGCRQECCRAAGREYARQRAARSLDNG